MEILHLVDHQDVGLPRAEFDGLIEQVLELCGWDRDQETGNNRWRASLQQEDLYQHWGCLKPSSRFKVVELVQQWLDRNQQQLDKQQNIERYRVSLVSACSSERVADF